jgi:hypothetical protein
MSDIDDDFESQRGEWDESPRVATLRDKLLTEWHDKFSDLPPPLQRVWEDTHRTDFVDASAFRDAPVYLVPLPAAVAEYPKGDRRFEKFLEFSDDIRRRLMREENYQRGSTLDEIEPDNRLPYLLADTIPAGEISVAYGKPKVGKSAWAQKLSICVASGSDFDGEPVTHGRVLYLTLDPGARKRNVKRRFMEICDRLGARPGSNLIIVDDPVLLDNPDSVETLLRKNPGEFALVVIDPLYRAISGDPSQGNLMQATTDGLTEIARATGAAVLVLHHSGRGDDKRLYGSVFLEGALDALLHVGRKNDRVTVTTELMKNGVPREAPLVYDLEGAYLENVAGVNVTAEAACAPNRTPSDIPHLGMLALIPEVRTPIRDVRKLIEQFLTGGSEARRKQWQRIRETWASAGLIEQSGGTIRRLWSPAP